MRYFCLTYAQQRDGSYTESSMIRRSLRARDYQICSVILDFHRQQVIKCSVNHVTVEKNWNRIVGYYRQFYPQVFLELDEVHAQS
jgi:hypothetical protein